jgi:hypothetical protein
MYGTRVRVLHNSSGASNIVYHTVELCSRSRARHPLARNPLEHHVHHAAGGKQISDFP